jgi:hypothetical protein
VICVRAAADEHWLMSVAWQAHLEYNTVMKHILNSASPSVASQVACQVLQSANTNRVCWPGGDIMHTRALPSTGAN